MKVNDLITKAKSYIGTPYVWGGDCASEGGLDCSGFIYKLLNDSGIKVRRCTAQTFYNKYRKNLITDIEVGTLLFFGSGKTKITHIALAISSTQMIESVGGSKNTIKNKGKGVTINNINRRKDLVAICKIDGVTYSNTIRLPEYYPNLKIGSRGEKVRQLQVVLNYFSPANSIVTDGVFGAKTKAKLIEFQKAYYLTCDGVFGIHTYTKMKALLNV